MITYYAFAQYTQPRVLESLNESNSITWLMKICFAIGTWPHLSKNFK